MVNDNKAQKENCGIAFSSGIRRHVTKPKIYDEATHVRLPAGTKKRIDAVRGDMRQADFIRQALMDELERLESVAGKGEKPRKG
jgi:hypothetical protein